MRNKQKRRIERLLELLEKLEEESGIVKAKLSQGFMVGSNISILRREADKALAAEQFQFYTTYGYFLGDR